MSTQQRINLAGLPGRLVISALCVVWMAAALYYGLTDPTLPSPELGMAASVLMGVGGLVYAWGYRQLVVLDGDQVRVMKGLFQATEREVVPLAALKAIRIHAQTTREYNYKEQRTESSTWHHLLLAQEGGRPVELRSYYFRISARGAGKRLEAALGVPLAE